MAVVYLNNLSVGMIGILCRLGDRAVACNLQEVGSIPGSAIDLLGKLDQVTSITVSASVPSLVK